MEAALYIVLFLVCVLIAMKVIFHLLLVRGLETAVLKIAANQKKIYQLTRSNEMMLDRINEQLYEYERKREK